MTLTNKENNVEDKPYKHLVKLTSKEFTAEELGFTPLIFSNSYVFMQYGKSESQLKNIEITPGTQIIENNLDAFNYHEIIIPIFIIKSKIIGHSIGDFNGSIYGIIRPKLLLNYGKMPPTTRPVPNQIPDFHFLMELKKISGEKGISPTNKVYEGINLDSDKEYLMCGIGEKSNVNLEKIIPRFEIRGLAEMCTFYANKR